jgi:hypothetical protein
MLYLDHTSLVKLRKVHSKTQNCIQEDMHTLDFEIVYKKGSKMLVYYLSQNIMDVISWDQNQLLQEQDHNLLIHLYNKFINIRSSIQTCLCKPGYAYMRRTPLWKMI